MEETLQKWWAQKYKLPSNHDLFVDRTWYEHAVEFHLDYFEQNPLEAHRQADGHVQFTNTGDPLIDKWEEQIAQGEEPDLTEAFSSEGLQRLRNFSNRKRDKDVSSFKDMYDSIAAKADREGLAMAGEAPRRPLRPTFPAGDK